MSVRRARKLRHQTTAAEKLLWQHIRNRQFNGLKFRRQHPVGRYVADFCCEEALIIIEVDGSQHAIEKEADDARTRYLENFGYKVLRYWNNDVLGNIEGVLVDLDERTKNLN